MTLAAGENPLRLAKRSLNIFLSSGSGLLSLSPDLADSAILLSFEALKVLRAAAEKLTFSWFGAAWFGSVSDSPLISVNRPCPSLDGTESSVTEPNQAAPNQENVSF